MCISAGQNGARVIKMAREEIGLQPRSKVRLRHAQQDCDTISSEVFLHFSRARENVCYQGIAGRFVLPLHSHHVYEHDLILTVYDQNRIP